MSSIQLLGTRLQSVPDLTGLQRAAQAFLSQASPDSPSVHARTQAVLPQELESLSQRGSSGVFSLWL